MSTEVVEVVVVVVVVVTDVDESRVGNDVGDIVRVGDGDESRVGDCDGGMKVGFDVGVTIEGGTLLPPPHVQHMSFEENPSPSYRPHQ